MLHAVVGPAARDTLCRAFDGARHSIAAAFYTLDDPRVVDSLERAAQRGCRVCLTVEGDPHRYDVEPAARRGAQAIARVAASIASYRARLGDGVKLHACYDSRALMHEKAAVVDGRAGYIETANATVSGARDQGDTLVVVHGRRAVDALLRDVAPRARVASAGAVVAGPGRSLRRRIQRLMRSRAGVSIAAEALSDARIASLLSRRAARGHHDRVLVGPPETWSKAQRAVVARLVRAGVAVRSARACHIHDKYVDDGARIYIGSANLTYDGLDRAREVGVIAAAASFDDSARALRADFRRRWAAAAVV